MGDESKAVRTVETGERKDRILIVEDEDNARKGYEQLLQRWGYEVLGVGTAEDALAKFSNFQPDTLIADVELPGMNGLDLLKQLGDDLQGVPAIIITGKGSEERAVAAIEAGAFWYIEKPLKGPVLRALLDRALSKARDAHNLAVLQRQLRGWTAGRHCGRFKAYAGSDAHHRNGCAEFSLGFDHWRNWSGQRNRGSHDSQTFAPGGRPVCGHQLLGDSRNADGERNFRARTRRVYRGGGAPHWVFRIGRRWNAAAG